MGCEMLSDAGLLSGFLHGFVALFTLVFDVFFDVSMYDKCQNSWWYDFGYFIGLGVAVRIGLSSFTSFIIVLVLMLVGLIALWIGGLILIGVAIAIVLFIVWFLFNLLKESS